MYRALISFYLFSILFLVGCDSSNFVHIPSNETYARSQLKNYNVAQMMLYVERGEMAETLPVLYKETGGGGLLGKDILLAWYRADSPAPLQGYLYSDINVSDRSAAGLVAYPAKPGKTGNQVWMLLINPEGDPGQWPVNGDAARIFHRQAEGAQLPITEWPTTAELNSDWQEVKRLTPRQGLRKAHKIYDDYRSNNE